MNGPDVWCPACRAAMSAVLASHPSYRATEPPSGIYHCAACGSAAAWPRIVPDDLYDVIYAQAGRIPGYARYAGYADLVARSDAPLETLAAQEDVYWGIATALQGLGGPPHVSRVLDIGCGLGYLTHALAMAGYDAHGLDASGTAIAAARARFGDRFVHASVADLLDTAPQSWSVAILAEIVEHVADPAALLHMAYQLLAPGGALIVTTPNRSAFPSQVVWHTDPPPVHLSWFSEDGVRRMGDAIGADTTLVDFTEYSARHATWRHAVAEGAVTRGSLLNAAGHPLEAPWTPGPLRRLLAASPAGRAVLAIGQRLKGRARITGARRETLVAVLRRPT